MIDATALAPTTELSDEERARRERQRTGALSGILEYFISPSTGAILVPLDGRLYHLDLADDTSSGGSTLATRVTKIGPSSGAATDATFSPRGSLVAFVCDQNLHMTDLTLCESRRLTTDGGGPIKNGMSEFVAQEEMNRHTGYWWSPHGSHIAFARVDESRVSLKDRFEIAADGIAAHSQRYPAAGQLNVSIQLGVVAIASGHTVWMDLGDDPDFYLARVGWLPGGRSLAVQIQSRDQRRLDLRFFNIETGSGRAILTETSDTWVEPHDELSFLSSSDEFIWASSRDGHRHLYLYDIRGQRLRQLTAGEWDVDDLRGRALKSIDEKGRWIYFTATAKDPTERHLYRCPLDPGPTGNVDPPTPQRISHEEGLHSVKMAPGTDFYVDLFASETQPPRLDLR
ncbi:MAG TPA: DPP IV N-terminal domain-containing protein, partial [Steroidobacteraceae bacterium]|nr:DPP IV N-terminal domain-containing protein [Steroidobacteraceae bacterium]